MDFANIFEANRASLRHVRELCDGRSANELAGVLPNGWTLAVTLAHLAFWDQKVIYALERSQADNQVWNIIFDDALNDILAPLLAAIPPQAALGLALRTGERLDAMLESCPSELLQGFYDANPRWVNRSLHREGHLADIQQFLSS